MRTTTKKIAGIVSLSVFFLLILTFAFYQSHDLIFGVKIKNVNITDGAKATENVLKITGNAKNAIKLSLNDRDISVDEDGNFNETIVLLLGYNVISIKATDKFGYNDEKDYKLIY